MADATCEARRNDGGACRMRPLTGSPYCWSHDPAHAAEAAEARRRGGLRKSKEQAIRGVFDLEGIQTLEDIWRVAEIGIVDTLLLDNSAGRTRALFGGCEFLLKLAEASNVEARLQAFESAFRRRKKKGKG